MLQMVIMRAQRPCSIYIGSVFPLTMEHFQNVSLISLYKLMIFNKNQCPIQKYEYTGTMTLHSEDS